MKSLFNLVVFLIVLTVPRCQESAISNEISQQLSQPIGLNYPLTVKRIYTAAQFESIWIKDELKSDKTWSSMLLLDCVLQFGLSHDDYHPDQLQYPKLREMLKNLKKGTAKDRGAFEIYLTDALVTFINDLHFGKANPLFPRYQIDKGNIPGFSAEQVLKNALASKDFMTVVLNVQPKSIAYTDLQRYMKLIRGQYLDDCYEVPEAEVRKVAINMERLKWNVDTAKSFIEVNIPSHTLTYHLPDTIYTFEVTVGKPSTPTPLMQSALTYVGTAPDWKVPQTMFAGEILSKAIADPQYLAKNHYTIYDSNNNLVVESRSMLEQVRKNPSAYTARQSFGCEPSLGRMAFHFPNENGVYLYDAQKDLFESRDRNLSNGCVGIANAEKLATLLLTIDGQQALAPELLAAAGSYKARNFIFKKQVPISIVYQTCAIKDGLLVTYPDPYNRDKELERNIYRHDVMLAKN